MTYEHLSASERRIFISLKQQGKSLAEIGRVTGRHRSTVLRELQRNIHHNGDRAYYTHSKAHQKAIARRTHSRRNRQFNQDDWGLVIELLEEDWSPEQIANWLRLKGLLSISHETIYSFIYRDRARGGCLHTHLRLRARKRRKRYGTYDKRGRLLGKRMIAERPKSIEARKEIGHWEIDTVIGSGSKDCVVTMVERATGFLVMGKLSTKTADELAAKVIEMIRRHKKKVTTITADNGTEFHGYKEIEDATGVIFYFANPHHSWERGSNENTNGLVRQYLPKKTSMEDVDQRHCDLIAQRLNERPRKRLLYQTPEMCYALTN